MKKSKALDYDFYFGASAEIMRRAAELRRNMTDAESLVWAKLRNRQVCNQKFRRQHPINNFIADFYCHQKRLVVEIDGGIHSIPEQHERDQGRTYMMNQLDLEVLRFTNDEVYDNIDGVIETIRRTIEGN